MTTFPNMEESRNHQKTYEICIWINSQEFFFNSPTAPKIRAGDRKKKKKSYRVPTKGAQ